MLLLGSQVRSGFFKFTAIGKCWKWQFTTFHLCLYSFVIISVLLFSVFNLKLTTVQSVWQCLSLVPLSPREKEREAIKKGGHVASRLGHVHHHLNYNRPYILHTHTNIRVHSLWLSVVLHTTFSWHGTDDPTFQSCKKGSRRRKEIGRKLSPDRWWRSCWLPTTVCTKSSCLVQGYLSFLYESWYMD